MTAAPGTALPVDEFQEIDDVPEAMLCGIERFLIEYSAEGGHEIVFKAKATKAQAFDRVKTGSARYKKNRN